MSTPQLPTPSYSPEKTETSLVVFGFKFWSHKLTRPMKRQIREFVLANPKAISITAQGSTHIDTLADRLLATSWGEEARVYIQKINPDIHAKTLQGSHIDDLDDVRDRIILTAR